LILTNNNMTKKITTLLLVTLLFSVEAQAKRKAKPSPIDHMALATMMIYDGSFEKAAVELEEVDKNKKDFDIAKYYSMQGIVSMKLERYEKAVGFFNKAITQTKIKVYKAPAEAKEKFTLYKYAKKLINGEEKKVKKPSFDPEKRRAEQLSKLYLYTSEAHYKLEEYKKVIETLDLAGEAGKNKAKLYTLRADCYWKLKEYSNALDIINQGFEKFPKKSILLKQKFYYLIDLGLFQHALEISDQYFATITPTAKDYIIFAQTLASSAQLDKAIMILEKSKLLFPEDAKTGVLLGHLYLKKDMVHVTADLFERSSYYDHNFTAEAAEMHRRASSIPHALYLNSQITDKAEKIKQKIAIFIQRGEFVRVIGLKDAMYRYNILKDENLRYALAYSYFMVKDYKKAEFHLKKLTKSELFSKATLIRKNIEKCKNNSMECL